MAGRMNVTPSLWLIDTLIISVWMTVLPCFSFPRMYLNIMKKFIPLETINKTDFCEVETFVLITLQPVAW